MIDYEIAREEFNRFIEQYDMTKDKISLKRDHTFRVVDNAEYIAKSLKPDNEEFINLCKVISLLHDIARFEQATVFDSFDDRTTIDHADLGVMILKKDDYIYKFCPDEKYHYTIYTAIRNHNKFKIEDGLNYLDLEQAQIVRDADKLDILKVYIERAIAKKGENYSKEQLYASDSVIDDMLNDREVIYKGNETTMDLYMGALGFINDIYYPASMAKIVKEGYVEKLIDCMEPLIQEEQKNVFEIIKEKVLNNSRKLGMEYAGI